MGLFWFEMDYWERLDARVAAALVQVWNDASSVLHHPREEKFLRKLLEFDNMTNGVRNCVAHFMGSMVREAVGRSSEQLALEAIVSDLQSLAYKDYIKLLESCSCSTCTEVIEFDTRYERYEAKVIIFVFFKRRQCTINGLRKLN